MLSGTGARQPETVMSEIVELAPAKINLALHVTGQRPDGYHLLESIVTFADTGDRLTFSRSDEDRFTLSGRFSETLTEEAGSNLVIRARDRLRDLFHKAGVATTPVSIHLEKNLPIASGIGGGSADAAATLRGLQRLWQASPDADDLAHLALTLGADVPMCLEGVPALARGVGEELHPLSRFPSLPMVIGNPLRGVSTPEVFSKLGTKHNPPLGSLDDSDWMDTLSRLRNDLEGPARGLVPEIGEISGLIAAEGALLTRMSGSGATCFGIFASGSAAAHAAARLRALKPCWYFEATQTIAGS
ncbi:4-(cytidine 5'-diphospho)-2-C-methyl-D-erythritol kinase [Neorhizobium sp. T786]|uniref:4-(cytidine 5'-diphospho)-2-C-methyl-D-erythritol kinase n=1 Tax=Pseudorhizobium xiangyangii TaxID=2883104 RepID=UPI001CFFCC4D|nr:4-(cytidine 5'-diphospho)-2-C-methyl-D-erythritol kinase [Neorhizobium xiangyangii]